MSDDTIPVTAPPKFYEAPGARISARGFGTVVQLVPDNLRVEDMQRMMRIILDALNRDFTPGANPPSVALLHRRGEVR